MTTKELIAKLNMADPTGEIEVCVGNHDIYFLEVQPSYYDGCLQRLIIDPSKKPFYCITGARILCSGKKLVLHTMGVEDVILDEPDVEVDLSDLEKNMPTSFVSWKNRVEGWRNETKDIIAQIEQEQKEAKP